MSMDHEHDWQHAEVACIDPDCLVGDPCHMAHPAVACVCGEVVDLLLDPKEV